MICISIGDFGLDACKKALRRCEKYRRQFPDIVAEIRLDLCGLSTSDVHELFSGAKVPLIATGMKRSVRLYEAAVLSGAAYVDVNVFSFLNLKKEDQVLLRGRNAKLILSFHDYQTTPSIDALARIYRDAVAAGADIVKIVTAADTAEDALRVLDLYRLRNEGKLGRKKVPLIAFAMGDAGRFSRLEALNLGSPFIYCALRKKYILAPGMFTMDEAENFHDGTKVSGSVSVPASKSIAQRAIVAAMLAKGESEFHNCTRCRDIDSAIGVARQFATEAYMDKGDNLIVRGGFPPEKKKEESPFMGLTSMSMQGLQGGRTAFVGESGLLSRLCIPVVAQFGESVTVTGEGSLLDRHMYGCKEAMEELGASCILTAEETLPAVVCGPIKGGEITISGKRGSQFITGLLMALPLSKKDSVLRVQNATSVPYILLTVDVIRQFGIKVDWRREGDELVFIIPGKQKYSPTEMTFEGDWSAAVNFIVAAAIFGTLTVTGLKTDSLQADSRILDVVRASGAFVQETKNGITVSRGSLRAFDFDATDSPDLLPALSVMAAFAEGTSHFTGVARLRNKESNRPVVMEEGLKAMGVEARVDGDMMEVSGMSLTRRIVEGRMLKGGSFHTFSDHRVAMALKIASLGCDSKVILDSTDCIDKSFPGFLKLFDSIHQ
ncbi:MAG TPA: 3-phosphoshikimate 1-carboxyvinyltransferase [Candidatus Coprenecus stercoravium]|uniref:3-phosphoshikimate 1-carboxyvinyltransferase n=1 Tax=Candidatus Coprenecus stercoravium TaxID=2840735 RepID=A0A9D2K9M9_9BACT|nr:3-phosphoshikimate 1-carboxyvinyltransferase [Candidatus Coprenecus stercoravium]